MLLSTTLMSLASCKSTEIVAGDFCDLYTPIPKEEGSGPAILRNEITHCVMCDPNCPDAVVRAWREQQ